MDREESHAIIDHRWDGRNSWPQEVFPRKEVTGRAAGLRGVVHDIATTIHPQNTSSGARFTVHRKDGWSLGPVTDRATVSPTLGVTVEMAGAAEPIVTPGYRVAPFPEGTFVDTLPGRYAVFTRAIREAGTPPDPARAWGGFVAADLDAAREWAAYTLGGSLSTAAAIVDRATNTYLGDITTNRGRVFTPAGSHQPEAVTIRAFERIAHALTPHIEGIERQEAAQRDGRIRAAADAMIL
jgi:hypothetical protein